MIMNMIKEAKSTRIADSKGRVTLGEEFANKTVIVKSRAQGEVLISIARVIPEREAWLYKNPVALASIRRGLAQAKGRQFSTNPPDLEKAKNLADQIEDN